jgi:hypothetical protein
MAVSKVKRFVSPTFGTFAWEEEVALFLTADGAVTFVDTGTPHVRRGVAGR